MNFAVVSIVFFIIIVIINTIIFIIFIISCLELCFIMAMLYAILREFYSTLLALTFLALG